MTSFNRCALGASALVGLLGWGAGASAALTISIDPAAVEGTPSSSFVFSLDIDDFTDLGIDVSDAPRIGAVINVLPTGGTVTPGPFTVTDVAPGSYFDTLFNPVGLAVPSGGDFVIEVTYSAFDPDTLETVPMPVSGRFASFTLTPTALAAPGAWTVNANLFVDNESDPVLLSNTVSASVVLVPEPETYALFAAGLLAVAAGVRRRSH